MVNFPWPLTFHVGKGDWLPVAYIELDRHTVAIVKHVNSNPVTYSVHDKGDGNWRQLATANDELELLALLTELEKRYGP